MTRESQAPNWTTVLSAAAIGAAVMYVLDPDKGRRRRALGRDKVRLMVGNARDFFDVAARDTRYRWQGLRAKMRRHLLRREGTPDHLMLIERARSAMGRVVTHPHAIQIGANEGTLTVSGPILANEVDALLDAMRAVPGVRDVEDRLVRYERAESIPALQGGVPREPRAEILQENWTPALRMIAMLGGGLLAIYGAKSRSLSGAVLATVGVCLAARGATNTPLDRVTGIANERGAVEAERTVEVGAQPEAAAQPQQGPFVH